MSADPDPACPPDSDSDPCRLIDYGFSEAHFGKALKPTFEILLEPPDLGEIQADHSEAFEGFAMFSGPANSVKMTPEEFAKGVVADYQETLEDWEAGDVGRTSGSPEEILGELEALLQAEQREAGTIVVPLTPKAAGPDEEPIWFVFESLGPITGGLLVYVHNIALNVASKGKPDVTALYNGEGVVQVYQNGVVFALDCDE